MLLSGRWLAWQAPRKAGLALVVGAALLAPVSVFAKQAMAVQGTVALAELPREARTTVAAVRAGGPFVHGKDGSVFGNRERKLPAQAKGYYREYTVNTPGATDRGARRVVCGGREPTVPQVCYYTGDHYASFRRIVE